MIHWGKDSLSKVRYLFGRLNTSNQCTIFFGIFLNITIHLHCFITPKNGWHFMTPVLITKKNHGKNKSSSKRPIYPPQENLSCPVADTHRFLEPRGAVGTWDFLKLKKSMAFRTIIGVCLVITSNNPKNLEKSWITKGLETWQSLGLILSMVTVGAYGGPRTTALTEQTVQQVVPTYR